MRTEFSEDFVRKMKNRMITSFHKYGPIDINARLGNDAIKDLKKRLNLYEETGNTEWLVDVGNFAMIEFMYSHHPNAHFRSTDSSESPGVDGLTIREKEKFDEKNRKENTWKRQ